MKNISLAIVSLLISTIAFAQVGINTSTPNDSAALDITSTNQGVLVPRIALTGSNDTSTITNGNIEGLMIYNTTTTATLAKGFCFWNGTVWTNMQDSQDIKSVTSELIFDGEDIASGAFSNFYYVSMVVDGDWKVIRYDKLDVNLENVATQANNGGQTAQPITLADCVTLTFI